jgi:ANTAR domain
VIPGPRPPKGHDRPSAGSRDRGRAAHLTHRPATGPHLAPASACEQAPVSVVRTSRGWTVVMPQGTEPAADLGEAMSLADLVTEEYGGSLEPDRTTRRSARGPGQAADVADPADARVAELERTVAQLEHALAARVTTERAIGVLAERHGTTPRAAFESLRRDARSHGRPVHELAGQVLDTLAEQPRADGVVLHVAATPSAGQGAAPLTVPTVAIPPLVPPGPAAVETVADGRP